MRLTIDILLRLLFCFCSFCTKVFALSSRSFSIDLFSFFFSFVVRYFEGSDRI